MTREQLRASISDQTALICTLLGEAANEPLEGQVAVASVIRTRAQHPRWWGRGWKGVCLAKLQFSCWWESNSNSERVYALADALMRQQAATGPGSLVGQLQWIAAGVMDDALMDNTGSADHYLTRRLYESDGCPKWAKGKKPIAVRGAHCFFRLEV